MGNRKVVYTAVVDNYDLLFSPAVKEEDIDYICFTNTPNLKAKGWEIRPLVEDFQNSTLSNRYHKFFPHEILKEYDTSLYIDGNIKVLGRVSGLFDEFEESQKEIGLLKHPDRRSVEEEVGACVEFHKVESGEELKKRVEFFLSEGFDMNTRLTENNFIFRNHKSERLPEAMKEWWKEVNEHIPRDQLSMPYIRWKHSLDALLYDFNGRMENPYLRVFPHRNKSTKKNINVLISAYKYNIKEFFKEKLWF